MRIRARSVALAAPLSAEDAAVQSMPDASPTKWHLAHTSWFFEQFLLGAQPDYQPWRSGWAELFNSYYEAVGPRHQRAARGMLTRPSLAEVLAYRAVIDQRVVALLEADAAHAAIVELGLQHEQQHQELLLTDVKHLLSLNPLQPAYRDDLPQRRANAVPLRFIAGIEGEAQIGHCGSGFAFDCETPRHAVLLGAHAIANRPVNNGEYREFIHDGGYRSTGLWLSEGWATVQREGWHAPLYWNETHDAEFTLGGQRALDPLAPVCHLSYYEADAFARWAGMRLPTEAEWEALAATQPAAAVGSDALHPEPPGDAAGLLQLSGAVWQWTSSPYVPYPRYRPLPGALGEYNGKFMCGQWVLRGGSCVTPAGHTRPSYRNFFYPRDRWQFSGLRLAIDR
jgi:ergothioneine biosynthesis protein EgtB